MAGVEPNLIAWNTNHTCKLGTQRRNTHKPYKTNQAMHAECAHAEQCPLCLFNLKSLLSLRQKGMPHQPPHLAAAEQRLQGALLSVTRFLTKCSHSSIEAYTHVCQLRPCQVAGSEFADVHSCGGHRILPSVHCLCVCFSGRSRAALTAAAVAKNATGFQGPLKSNL